VGARAEISLHVFGCGFRLTDARPLFCFITWVI
jgi:hypothetical protein